MIILLFRFLRRLAIVAVPVALGLSACDSAEDRAASHMDRGIASFEAERYDRARIDFKNALQIQPTNGRAYYYLGRVYEKQRLWAEAARAFARAVEQEPDHIDANIRLGRYYVLGKNPSKGRERAEHVIEITDGKSAEGYALRASAALASKDFEEAHEDATRSLELSPGNPTATSVLVGLYRNENKLPQAIDVLSTALDQNPTDTALRLTKIGLHLDLNQNKDAEADAIALTKIEPGVPRHYINLARLYVKWNRLDDAEHILRNLVVRRGGETTTKLALIDFLVNQRGRKAAENALKAFIAETPKDEALRFALVEVYRRDGKMAEAKEELNKIAAIWPQEKEGHRAQVALAGLFLADGSVEEARRAVAGVLHADPKNPAALMLRARISLREAEFDDAIQALRTILRDQPESKAALELLSDAYLTNNQKELAIDTLGRLVNVDPTADDTRIRLAQLLGESRKFDAALKLLNDTLERNPRELRALATKAEVLLAGKQFGQAATVADEIERMPRGGLVALKLRGWIAAAEGRHDDAVTMFRQARAVAPGDWQAVDGLVRSLVPAGKTDEALSLLRQAVSRQPDHRQAWVRLGDVQMVRNDPPAAVEAYEKAIGIDGRSLEAHARLVALHSRLGNEKEVVESLQRAAKANPGNVEIGFSLALALERAGRFGDAIEVYEALRATGRRDVAVVNNLAALIADHQYEDASRIAQAIEMMAPFQASNNPMVIDTIGWLHVRAGNIAQAISFLKRAVALDSDNKVLRRHMSEAYRLAGMEELAARYETASPTSPKDPADLAEGEVK